MVDAVVPCLTGLFFVTIIAFEKTDGLLVAHTNHDFALFTILTAGTVSTQQVDIILGIGNTHGTRFRCHPGEGAKTHGGFSLSEALHDVQAYQLLQLVEHGRIQGLTGRTAVFE